MAHSALKQFLRATFAPPIYLAMPNAGIDISASGVKAVTVVEHHHGLQIKHFTEVRLPAGAVGGGKVIDEALVEQALHELAQTCGIRNANIALSETKQASISSADPNLDTERIESVLHMFDDLHIRIGAIEYEAFSAARALLPQDDQRTVLIVDLGRTTTKLTIVAKRVPRFATTLASTHSSAERVCDEVARSVTRWQSDEALTSEHGKIQRTILVGGGANARGLLEYFEGVLSMPIELGDVFTNFASRDHWLPPMEYRESLAYATAIGLAIREYTL